MAVPAVPQVAFTLINFGLRLPPGYAQCPALMIVIIAGPALAVVITVLPPVLAYLRNSGIGVVACPLVRGSISTLTVFMIRQCNRGKEQQ